MGNELILSFPYLISGAQIGGRSKEGERCFIGGYRKNTKASCRSGFGLYFMPSQVQLSEEIILGKQT